MPTFERTDPFRDDFKKLSPVERAAFNAAVQKLVHDLRTGTIRKGLRVKRLQGYRGFWEMTWADDGRAVFEYGPTLLPGHPHVIWRRVGSHDIFENP